MTEKQGHVYILELEGGFWYVGFSQDLNTRIASHFLGAGAKWTQLHKPIAVHSVKPGTPLLETAVAVGMMCQYGWEKVRGGSFVNVDMARAPACISKAKHYASYKTSETGGASSSYGDGEGELGSDLALLAHNPDAHRTKA